MPITQANAFPRERFNIALLAVAQSLFNITAITVMTLSGLMGRELAPDSMLATLPISAMMLGTLLSTLPASLFMQRFGRRNGFLLGTSFGGILGGALSVLAIANASFQLFCFASLLLGIYQGFAMYYRFAAVDVVRPQWHSRAISLVLAGGVIAAFLGPWNASAMLDLLPAVPNAGPYAVITALSVLAMLLLSMLRVPPCREPGIDQPHRPLRAITAQVDFRVAVLAGAVAYAVMVMLMSATPLGMRAAGFAMSDISFIMQWHVLGMFAPSFFTGFLITRFGLGKILLTGCVLLVFSVLTAAAGQTLTHYWLALVLLGVGWNFLFVGGSDLLTHTHTPTERGITQGVNDLIVYGMVVTSSLLSGVLVHYLGWSLLNLSALLPILTTLAVVLWWQQRRRLQSSPAVETR
ncbi:MAG: MFS transporter [Gammaproteobacteria bacterium]|nr:MFS transporter [Gammaproteobacteria bacterium]